MNCNYCGYENRDGSAFCCNCGAYIKAEQTFNNTQNNAQSYDNIRPVNEYTNPTFGQSHPNQNRNSYNQQESGQLNQGYNAEQNNNSFSPDYNYGQNNNYQNGNYNVPPQFIPPSYPNNYYGPPQGYYNQTGQTSSSASGMSVVALVLGIVSLLSSINCVGFILGILAVTFGFISCGKLKNAGVSTGKSVAGIITGFIGIFIFLILLFM